MYFLQEKKVSDGSIIIETRQVLLYIMLSLPKKWEEHFHPALSLRLLLFSSFLVFWTGLLIDIGRYVSSLLYFTPLNSGITYSWIYKLTSGIWALSHIMRTILLYPFHRRIVCMNNENYLRVLSQEINRISWFFCSKMKIE